VPVSLLNCPDVPVTIESKTLKQKLSSHRDIILKPYAAFDEEEWGDEMPTPGLFKEAFHTVSLMTYCYI